MNSALNLYDGPASWTDALIRCILICKVLHRICYLYKNRKMRVNTHVMHITAYEYNIKHEMKSRSVFSTVHTCKEETKTSAGDTLNIYTLHICTFVCISIAIWYTKRKVNASIT